jgi:transforming growth factor-beta-induced protein
MKTRIITLFLLLTLVFASSSAVLANENSIYDIAKAAGSFDTLVAAVEQEGLAGTLDGAGSFTVFAPTDAAFAAFAASGIDPEASLASILTYHVVPGTYMSGDVVAADMLPTVFGKSLSVEVVDGNVVIDGRATVTAVDIEAANGVIHVIDAVLPPPVNALDLSPLGDPNLSIAEIAIADGRFDTLVAALSAAGLAETFASPGNYTVFAPTDDAFAALGQDTINALLADPTGQLTDILTFHVVNDTLSVNQVLNDADGWLPTLNGTPAQVSGGTIDGANIVLFNIRASNGVIHVIDTVMLP